MSTRVLSDEDIQIGLELRFIRRFSLRKIVKHYNSNGVEVGLTAVYENLCKPPKRDRREYLKNYFRTAYKKPVCNPCARCEICLTKELEDGYIPINYQVGEQCVTCYLRSRGFDYMNLYA